MPLWLNLRLIEPQHLKCFHEVFQFAFNGSTNTFVPPPGVETRIVPNSANGSFLHGLLWEYIGLQRFRSHFVQQLNYTDGWNLHSIPYDFRRGTLKALNGFARDLKALVELTYARNVNQRVFLITHSTGGSMALFFLAQQPQSWKDRYIAGWISLSGNIAGEVDNIQSLIQGFLSPTVSRDVLRTWDFFAWRLPEPMIYGPDRILVQTPTKNYTALDMRELLQDMNAEGLARVYPEASSILADLPAPNVDTYCFYGANISTAIGYLSTSNHFDTRELSTVYGWGDGEQDDTTNMSCQRWRKTMDPRYRLMLKGFDRVGHVALVGNKQVLEEIDQIVRPATRRMNSANLR